MKLRLCSSTLLYTLAAAAFASHPPIETAIASEKCYIGFFGGGGASDHFDAKQFGTAFFTEAEGGPLSVNAFGQLGSQDTSLFGVQLGYQAEERVLHFSSQWTFAPAVELEAYVMNKRTFEGTFINHTARLAEHDFNVSYPMKKNVFLANAVINFNHAGLLVHPYIGFGIGSAIVKIADASATQSNPPEAGINHYNTQSSDTTSSFAGQIKLGLSYDISNCVSLFADYRWLYVANTDFVFGSTVYPTHVETSPWQVRIEAQKYNLGSLGVRLNW